MQETKEMWAQFLGWEDPVERHSKPPQYSCLENPMDIELQSWTWLKQLSMNAHVLQVDDALNHYNLQWSPDEELVISNLEIIFIYQNKTSESYHQDH